MMPLLRGHNARETRRALTLTTLLLLGGQAPGGPMLLWAQTPSRPRPTAPTINPQAAALQDFQRRLNEYLAFRMKLATSVTSVAPATKQSALAVAVQQARAGARQGAVLPMLVQTQIRTTVAADFGRRDRAALRAAFEEVPLGRVPGINQPYPASAALATVPPLLLNSLPRLPESLQYRFFDRHIVLLDSETNLVVDYIANVLPALAQNDPEHH